jgi:hypothetical protein
MASLSLGRPGETPRVSPVGAAASRGGLGMAWVCDGS